MMSTLQGQTFRPHPEMRFASSDRQRPVSAPHPPRQNHLLAALPVEDYERLLPHLNWVSLPLGWTVHGAGDRQEHVYFLTTAIVSRFYVTQNGASAGLIDYSRGHIAVLDRVKLEERVCECYGVIKREYERLLPCKVHDLPMTIT
jgi:hypothetical protein